MITNRKNKKTIMSKNMKYFSKGKKLNNQLRNKKKTILKILIL